MGHNFREDLAQGPPDLALVAEIGHAAGSQHAAGDRETFHEDYLGAGARRGSRRADARDPAADHRHVGLVAERNLAAPRDLLRRSGRPVRAGVLRRRGARSLVRGQPAGGPGGGCGKELSTLHG